LKKWSKLHWGAITPLVAEPAPPGDSEMTLLFLEFSCHLSYYCPTTQS